MPLNRTCWTSFAMCFLLNGVEDLIDVVLEHVADFVRGLETVVVVEEKRSLIEVQLREALYGTANQPGVFFRHSHGDVDFFMLDVRYERDRPPAAGGLDLVLVPGELGLLQVGHRGRHVEDVGVVEAGLPVPGRDEQRPDLPAAQQRLIAHVSRKVGGVTLSIITNGQDVTGRWSPGSDRIFRF